MKLAEIRRCWEDVSEIHAQYHESMRQLCSDRAALDGVGAVHRPHGWEDVALEAHVRQYLLDRALVALGWATGTAERMVVEDSVRSMDGRGHRRRLDYYGRDSNDRRSLLVVEAKRPSVKLPFGRHSLDERFCDFANAVLKSKDSQVSGLTKWHDILASSFDYIRSVAESNGAAPVRMVISNGDWFIVFSDLDNVVDGIPIVPSQLAVFADFREVQHRFEHFYRLLAYSDLACIVPPQTPGALIDFVPASEEVVYTRIVDVSYSHHGRRQPLISICVGVNVLVPPYGWILFQKRYSDQFVILNSRPSNSIHEIDLIERRASELIAELSLKHRLCLASVEQTEDLLQRYGHRSDLLDFGQSDSSFTSQKIYRLVTRDEVQFVVKDPSHDRCAFHNWGDCRRAGNAVGAEPIVTPSFEKRSYFTSGSPFHCAHNVIQVTRDRVCRLSGFERHLCCRRCAFLQQCWPDPTEMPCQSS